MWGRRIGIILPVLWIGTTEAVSLSTGSATSTSNLSTRNKVAKKGPLYNVKIGGEIDLKAGPSCAEGCLVYFSREEQTLKLVQKQEEHVRKNAIASGTVRDHIEKNGWIDLRISTSTSEGVDNDLKMYAAGFLEGVMTAPRISQFFSNAMQSFMRDDDNKSALANMKIVFRDVEKYLKREANVAFGYNTSENPDPYWRHIRYIFSQMKGILDGYNVVAKAHEVRTLTMNDIFLLNSVGEMGELMEVYRPDMTIQRRKFQNGMTSLLQRSKKGLKKGDSFSSSSFFSLEEYLIGGRDKNSMTQAEIQRAADEFWEHKVRKTGHCSALVRVTPNNKDLLVGHTTWDDYSKMTRVFKYYDFNLDGAATRSNMVAMSSYPGVVSSTDDFYLTQSGLAIASTSLEILNPNLYNRIPEFPGNTKIPNFMHIMTCNRMAQTAGHWGALFTERNSGTGNAQWMVVDYNIFSSEKDINPGTLWVIEQIPGLTMKEDRSKDLTTGLKSMASFNRPIFKEVRVRTGHEDAQRLYGDLYSLKQSPRGQIFSQVENAIESLRDMRIALRRNEWPNEKFTGRSVGAWGSPGHAISARLDLDGSAPNGGIDAKVTSAELAKKMQVQAISGPTHMHQAPFQWQGDGGGEKFPGWPHLGLPNKYDFKWVQMTPQGEMDDKLDDMDATDDAEAPVA